MQYERDYAAYKNRKENEKQAAKQQSIMGIVSSGVKILGAEVVNQVVTPVLEAGSQLVKAGTDWMSNKYNEFKGRKALKEQGIKYSKDGDGNHTYEALDSNDLKAAEKAKDFSNPDKYWKRDRLPRWA